MYFADEETERVRYFAQDYTVTGRVKMRTQIGLTKYLDTFSLPAGPH